jgi:fermentation-respiration switch protein FrsA (DUF1100 family)
MVDDDEAGTAHHATIPIETRDAMMEDTIGAAGEPHASAWRHGRERARQIAQQALVLAYDVLAWLRAKQRTRNGRRVMTALTWLGVGALCIYIGAAAVLYFTQRSLMYFPETAHTTPAAAGLPQADEITLTTADGEHLIAWHVPPRDNKPVVLYLHGNGGSLRYRAERFQRLITDGIGLVAVEYRGYGGSSGSPSERGLIADGEAAYAFAAARYQVAQIVLWGESLGTGVAVALAAEKPVGRVILEAPFTSAEEVAARRYWIMPVRLLMTDQFRSDARIGKVTAPLLILHGTKDDTVPFAMGQRMFALANQPKHIVRFLDGGHDDLDRNGALIAVGRFLAGDLDP